MLDIHSSAYREQYNDNFICIIPTNIYGPNDNFHIEYGHVIPSLIHKCYIAKQNKEEFIIRGTGSPLRQFIYSEDLAYLIMWVLENYEEKENIILSVSEKMEISIKDIGVLIADAFNYKDKIKFDMSYSDGQYKKTVDNSKLMKLIESYDFVEISEGIKKTVEWFIKNYDKCRY